MRAVVAMLLLLCTAPAWFAQTQSSTQTTHFTQSASPGILQHVDNAQVAMRNGTILLTRIDRTEPIRLGFTQCLSIGVERDHDAWWVLPMSTQGSSIQANFGLWVLPDISDSQESSWYLDLRGNMATAEQTPSGTTVLLRADDIIMRRSEARPHSDIFGNRFSLELNGGPSLEGALAGFYWGTLLPSVVERTMAARFRYSDGYVLSTLDISKYAGSYPAVDHEFQIRGRLAFASAFDLDLVRRMLELQFRLMEDDPEHLSRAPTSVQPDGRREYHVRRDSEDRRDNAGMFPVTANIEVLEETYRWYAATGDRLWLRTHIHNLEQSAGWILADTDFYGRVWSDVYYEDQVIKDGRVTQAQAFAAHAFQQLAFMEHLLGRSAQAKSYQTWSRKMGHVLIAPIPLGYWDEQNQRFVDWVDRNGSVHDHIHLLANTLPVTFGFATSVQRADVQRLVHANETEFERFPSFLSAHIDEYTPSEIGIAGPYDLSAAGRYWYWDAAYRASQRQNGLLLQQLNAVAAEAEKNNGYMSERYDMDHVYYIDGKDAHGAGRYYEYPNVFTAVLISQYLGLTATTDADVRIAPHLAAYGAVRLDIPAYSMEYRWDKSGFILKNLATRPRRFVVDLSALTTGRQRYRMQGNAANSKNLSRVTLKPGQQVHWSIEETAARP